MELRECFACFKVSVNKIFSICGKLQFEVLIPKRALWLFGPRSLFGLFKRSLSLTTHYKGKRLIQFEMSFLIISLSLEFCRVSVREHYDCNYTTKKKEIKNSKYWVCAQIACVEDFTLKLAWIKKLIKMSQLDLPLKRTHVKIWSKKLSIEASPLPTFFSQIIH